MNVNIKIRFLFFMAYLCSTTTLTSAIEVSSVVGFIEELDGNVSPFERRDSCGGTVVPAAYTIIRGKELVKVGFLTELQADDLIVVNDHQHFLQIKFADRSEEKITFEKSPYLVKSRGNIPSVRNNLERWVKIFTGALQEDVMAVSVSTLGGGSQLLVMPLIKTRTGEPTKVLIEGKRELKLAWKGGKKDYRLVIQQDGKTLHALSTTEKQIKLPELLFTRGNYQLLLSDAEQHQVEYSFTVVGRESLPDYPHELSDDILRDLPELARLTIRTMWLSEQDKGKWSLEAYQQIVSNSEKYRFAKLLCEALESGVALGTQPTL